MPPLCRPLPSLALLACGCIGRFAAPAPPGETAPVDTGGEGGVCTTATVGPYVTAVSHDAATVVVRTDAPCRLVVEASPGADAPETSSVVGEGVTTSEGDLTARLRLEGLQPDTRYRYRLLQGDTPLQLASPRSFSTAPGPSEAVDLTIGFVSDALSHDGEPALAYASLGQQGPQLVLQIGDLDHRDPGRTAPWELESWRRMHREQLAEFDAGRTLDRSILADVAFFHTWDDHDYGNNDADGEAPWRDLALQAFQEYFPLPPDAPNPERGVWYALRWGQAEIFLLDLRSQRSPSEAEDDEDKSMLDHHRIDGGQLQWLLRQLEASDATWKIIVSSSCWNPYGKQSDSWAAYGYEQRELLQRMAEMGLSGVMVISGDMHSGGGIDDGRFAGLPEMSVPATNINLDNCTGGRCGNWSEGIQVGEEPAGFSTVSLHYDQSSGVHRAVLRTWSERGDERLALELNPEQAVVRRGPVSVDW
jgi:alkaline phosphatase D